jgi:tetratricopeptide (TPR) repeat protein
MADRHTYLPSIGIAVMLAWGIPTLIKREETRVKILFPVGTAFLAIMALLAWEQCGYWKNNATLFKHALQVTKNNYLAHDIFAFALFKEGKVKEAIDHCDNAIRINPTHFFAYANRGNAYVKLGQYQQAIDDYNEAIHINPYYTDAYNSRGIAYFKLGQNQQAIDDYNEAILLNPDYANAYFNRGIIYINQGNKNLGCRDAQKACDLGNCELLEAAKGKGYCR